MNAKTSETGAMDDFVALPGAQPRFHRFQFGEIECIALSDGGIPRPPVPGQDLVLLPLSCLLVRLPGTGLVLMDTGFGLNPMSHGQPLRTVGRVPASLKAAGISPAEINAVLISHIHPDHVGGMYGSDGAKLYPNATYYVGAEELAFWSQEPLDLQWTASPPPIKIQMAEHAKRMLGFAGDTLKTFRAGEEVLPGIGTILLPGHAPGQMGYILSSGNEKLLFTADAIADSAVSIQTPHVYNPMDMDPDLAVETRHKLIAMLLEPGWQSFTPHFPWPNLGRLKRGDAHAVWEPAA